MINAFSTLLVVVFFLLLTPEVRADEPCMVGEVTIRSRILYGQVVLHDRTKTKPASGALVEMFVLRDGEWELYTRVWPVNRETRFALLEVDPGRYYLVAQDNGFRPSKLYLNMMKGNAQTEAVIPLRKERCGKVRTQRAR